MLLFLFKLSFLLQVRASLFDELLVNRFAFPQVGTVEVGAGKSGFLKVEEGYLFPTEEFGCSSQMEDEQLFNLCLFPNRDEIMMRHSIKSALGSKGESFEFPAYVPADFFGTLPDDRVAQSLGVAWHVDLFFSTASGYQVAMPSMFDDYWEYIRDHPDFKELAADKIHHFVKEAIKRMMDPQIIDDLLNASFSGLSRQQVCELYDLINNLCAHLDALNFSPNSFSYLFRVVLAVFKYYDAVVIYDEVLQQNPNPKGTCWMILQLAPLFKPLFLQEIDEYEFDILIRPTFQIRNGHNLQIWYQEQYVALDLIFKEVFSHFQHRELVEHYSAVSAIIKIIDRLIPAERLEMTAGYCVTNRLPYLMEAIFYFAYRHGIVLMSLDEFVLAASFRSMSTRMSMISTFLAYYPISWERYEAIERKAIVEKFVAFCEAIEDDEALFDGQVCESGDGVSAASVSNPIDPVSEPIDPVTKPSENSISTASVSKPSEISASSASVSEPMENENELGQFPERFKEKYPDMAYTLAFLDILIAGMDGIDVDGREMLTFEPTEKFLELYKNLKITAFPILLELGRIFLCIQTDNPISGFSGESRTLEEFNWLDMINFINFYLELHGSGKFSICDVKDPFTGAGDKVQSNYLIATYQTGVPFKPDDSFFTQKPMPSEVMPVIDVEYTLS